MECFDEKTFSFIITDNYSGEGEENSIYEYASGDKISEYDVYLILLVLARMAYKSDEKYH